MAQPPRLSRSGADLVTYTDNILIMGDFNIHVDDPNNPLSKAFTALLYSTGLTQIFLFIYFILPLFSQVG